MVKSDATGSNHSFSWSATGDASAAGDDLY
ncbi:hypothetical protein C5167_033520 [Papaver somniferum]|uniref:Uncharacterized protein n=1 Tax=Papaver somniferum TaxID=3469 RepID=A0A4Y7KEQ6_PAPSO|nr:hypothetical protein C5167_033520 [Papaver somniferum]